MDIRYYLFILQILCIDFYFRTHIIMPNDQKKSVMKKLSTYVFILLVLLVSGCATSVPVKVTEPPELNYGGAKIIGVLPFSTSQQNAASSMRQDRIYNYYNYYVNRALNEEMKLASTLTTKLESLTGL